MGIVTSHPVLRPVSVLGLKHAKWCCRLGHCHLPFCAQTCQHARLKACPMVLQGQGSHAFHVKQLGLVRTIYIYIYMVYVRYFWQENHQIYGHIRCIYSILANPTHSPSENARGASQTQQQGT
jgi:hypothetical protein